MVTCRKNSEVLPVPLEASCQARRRSDACSFSRGMLWPPQASLASHTCSLLPQGLGTRCSPSLHVLLCALHLGHTSGFSPEATSCPLVLIQHPVIVLFTERVLLFNYPRSRVMICFTLVALTVLPKDSNSGGLIPPFLTPRIVPTLKRPK